MKIGILVYSQTGNTKSVAEKLKENLAALGHDVHLDDIIPQVEAHPGSKNVTFNSLPNTDTYEGIILASPVQAFSLAMGMQGYLPHLGSMKGKKVACLVTKQLPQTWTGGNKALRNMRKAVENKEGSVSESGIIIWSRKNREEIINDTVNRISRLF